MKTIGNTIERSIYHPLADVIGSVEVSGAGNVILRAGRENEAHGSWSQMLHIVLTPDEADLLIDELTAAVEDYRTRATLAATGHGG
jgi:hypothetical protein